MSAMALAIVSIAWLLTVAVLIGRAVSQFSAYRQVPVCGAAPAEWPSVSVIVPARNEEDNVEACLGALLGQDYPTDRLNVVLVDDGSGDRTGQIARAISLKDCRVQVVRAAALPQGWKGKPHACWQGATTLEASRPRWLCFIDCDTLAAADLIRRAVRDAEDRGIDLLSLEPFQILGSFWERVLIPAGFLLLAYSQDLRRVNDPSSEKAVANGQFILVRRSVYETVGGHAQVRDQICEDSALAALVKRSGFRIDVAGGESVLRTRMYHSLAEIWGGVSRNLIEMLGGAGKTLVFAALGVILAAAALALPALAIVQLSNASASKSWAWAAFCFAVAGSVALAAIHVGAAVRLRIPFWYGLLFPLGYATGAPLAAWSFWIRIRHRIVWKGRAYAASGAQG